MKKLLSMLFVCILICPALIPTAYAEPTPERKTIYLNVGDRYTIETGRTIGSDDFLNANWYSSDPSKLEIVGQNFNKDTSDVRALASSGGKIVTIRVEFEEYWGDPWLELIPGTFIYYFVIRGEDPQSITLPPTAEITDTTSITLTPEFTPENAETACTWWSSDTSVASVSDSGVVKGISKGTAVITAETVNGLTAQCTVTVRPTNACGEDLEWSLDGGVLTITGTGGMYDYGVDDTPWADHNDEITNIVVSEGVTGIGDYAFSSTAVSEVVLPESLLELGDEVFFDCPNLRHIELPSGLRSLTGDSLSGYALESISVSGENQYFSAYDGVLYNKDMTTLVRYPSGKDGDRFCIPPSVSQISHAAFYSTELKGLYVPETVTEIAYFGISTSGLTVYGAKGSAAEQAVLDYTSSGLTMYFTDISTAGCTMVSVGSAGGKAGDTVYVPVRLSGNTGFANLNIQISYDTSKLTLTSVQAQELGALYTPGAGMDTGVYNMSWDAADNITYNGTIATLAFEVKDLSGRTPIGVSFYTGLSGTYGDGYDVNYTAEYGPLDLWYLSGDIQSDDVLDAITIDNLSTGDTLSFSVQLASEHEMGGVLIAAVYDGDGRLCGLDLRKAAEHTTFAFAQIPDAQRFMVLWLESMENLKPISKSKEVTLSQAEK